VQSNTSTVTIDTGELGEQLVEEHFKHAERSDDWFDSEKDGTIKEKTYEVKTFRLNNRDQGFWVESSQFNKLDNVDILYFVKIPETKEEGATIYECLNHKSLNVYENFVLGQFKQMRCYFIDNCKFIANINDERTDTIYENSIAMSKHNRFT
tara:strand:- start:469 stop:924 length:456 start_codon:yes stop_codon:yes gene_type:complete